MTETCVSPELMQSLVVTRLHRAEGSHREPVRGSQCRKMQFGREFSLALLLTALLCVTAVPIDDNFTLCEPTNGHDNDSTVPLPSFPPQFSVQIEVASAPPNATLRIIEYYDSVGQRGRVDYYFRDFQATLISDFATDQAFHIAYIGGEIRYCNVVLLENDGATKYIFHEVPGPNGTLRIGSANDLLFFAGSLQDQEVYLGQEFMRGIPTDHWQYCFNSENLTVSFDYYFAVEDWSFPLNASRVPILATMDGRQRLSSGEIVNMQSTYTFTAFDPSPLGDDIFTVPEGVVCRNRKILKPLPALDVPYFSSISELTNTRNGHSSYNSFYYDRQANLVRHDFNFRNRSDPKSMVYRVSVIRDFLQGVQYWINRDNGTCNVTNLGTGQRHRDKVVDDHGNYVLASLLHILSPFNDSASAYVYEGPSMVRGIAAEAWLAFIPMPNSSYPNVTLENVTNLFYFTKDIWVVNGRNTKMQIPLRLRTRGTYMYNGTMGQFDFVSDIFNVDLQEPSFEVFDTFVCFPPNRTKEVMFTLPVSPAANTLFSLRSNIRTALSSFTGAPGSQFGNIQIQTYSEDSIVVNLLLHDPPNAGYRNGTRKNSQTLLQEITAGITNGTLKIRLFDGTQVSPQLLQQSCPSPTPVPSATSAVIPVSHSTPIPSANPSSSTASSPMPSSTPIPLANPSSSTASSPMPSSTPIPSASTSSNTTSIPMPKGSTPNPTLSLTSNPNSGPTPTFNPNPTPSPTSNPNLNPPSNPTVTQPNLVGVGVGCFFGGFITCLLLGLLVAAAAMAIRTCMRKRKYHDTGYSRQLDEL